MKRQRGWLVASAIVSTVISNTAWAQNGNPAPIRRGVGANGAGVGPTAAYGVGGGYTPPFGGGYGGFGNNYYNGIAVVSPPVWTAPIPAYGGYGFGPWGYNYTNASYAIGGMPDPVGEVQNYALANSRYDLQTAQTARAYAEANFFQQQAIAAARQNNDAQAPIAQRFNVRNAAPRSRPNASPDAPKVPLDQLMSRDGQVKWPDSAPGGEARDRVDAAVAKLAQQFKDDGKASVQGVNEARDALYAYGLPALASVRKGKPAAGANLKTFLNDVDAALIGMAGTH